jgi:hypothetical protein
MVHPESRRSEVIATWNPQLMVDSHEMGADDSYLFSPPRHPFNPHLPSSQQRWWDRFAADQAEALDARGYAYYTREWNEEFFPGYGSSWASYLGAVGILYEMSSTEGTVVRQRGGTLRTYAQAVEHHVASSVANLETLASNRKAVLQDFVVDRRAVIDRARRGPVAAWLLPEGRHPERTRALVELLRLQGVEVFGATSSPPRVTALRDALTGESVPPDRLQAMTWMVPVDQPLGALVRVLLDPHVPMDATFFREEREHLERGKGTRLYETTAWSLPLAYGIEHYWTSRRPESGWTDRPVPKPEGRMEAAESSYGYIIDGVPDSSVQALGDLLQAGMAVRLAERPFKVGGQPFPRGSILVKREGNPDDLAERLSRIAGQRGVQVRAAPTAKAEEGPDLGGRYFHPLVAPRVGIWTGMPVSPPAYGALWHLLDKEMGLRFAGLDLSRFSQADLNRYNVLIFPTVFGEPGVYEAILGKRGMKRLRSWIEAGGTAIGIGGGAEFLAGKENDLTKTRLRRQALERYPPVVLGPGAETAEAAGPFRAVGLRAGEEPEGQGEGESAGRPEAARFTGSSPYDVAPVLGPGARPFAEPFDQGTPVGMRPVSLADWLRPLLPPGQKKPEKDDFERADERLRRFSPRGAFLRIETDPNIWLAWGMPSELPAFTRSSDTLVAEPPVQVPAQFAGLERLHLGGLLWPEGAGRLARTAYTTREPLGRGQVILFLNEPEFRGWTRATRRLLLNAILYGPGMGTRWSTMW